MYHLVARSSCCPALFRQPLALWTLTWHVFSVVFVFVSDRKQKTKETEKRGKIKGEEWRTEPRGEGS